MSTGPSGTSGEAADGAEDRAGSGPGPAPDVTTSLLETLPIGSVLLDGRDTVLLWNPVMEEILGWPAEEAVGMAVSRLVLESDALDHARRVLREEHRWRGILSVRCRDGSVAEVEGQAATLYDAAENPLILANIAETARLRAVEQDLAALDALFVSSPIGIALFDTEGRFVRVNDELARLDGAAPEYHLGRTIPEVLPNWMAEDVAAAQDSVLETGQPVVDRVLTAPDGVGARSVSYGRLTDRHGRILGIVGAVMDITERRKAVQQVEAARQRLSLLDDVGVALGDQLEIHAVSQALASSLAPRFADYVGVMPHGEIAHGDELPRTGAVTGADLQLIGVAARYGGEAVDRLLHAGRELRVERGSVFGRVLATGTPYLVNSRRELIAAAGETDPMVSTALELDVNSLLAVPLRARGIVLGLLLIARSGGRAPFDHDDLTLVVEVADRAGTALDNARLYARERAGALTLQRSLLPQRVPEPPGIRVAYRYVPASSGTEVGGDWFDVIPLAAGRVAFVVGDVMGHGLRAAATMGRLRTAVRTLTGLDLSPDELLRRVNELADDLAQTPDEPLMATCVFALYDPSPTALAGRRGGLLTVATAGHMPPLLLTADGSGGRRARILDLPPGAPLGVGDVPFDSVEVEVAEGTVLILYTDGLVENRGEDITEGIGRLCAMLTQAGVDGEDADPLDERPGTGTGGHPRERPPGGAGSGGAAPGAEGGTAPAPGAARAVDTESGPEGPGWSEALAEETVENPGYEVPPDIENACDALIAARKRPTGEGTSAPEDDIALLMATLGGLPEGSSSSWTFSGGSHTVRAARYAVNETLREWGLAALCDTAVLLVSELVTNSVRYARGPVGLRLVRGTSLLVEVSDRLPDPPRVSHPTTDDEGGRGVALVARESSRWGTRYGPVGKSVWFELPLE
ncbi:SpoIIE family protein phosphatase [Streptomyces sp. AJS327]|uniref:SpoIIE family protein phosphatase n=1 Tax=Streptomyces sp. AJS327 TaxID=2545265 RepID=UPI0027E50119|nr:SpoIIE family protein phosphatase [Streptomyces sp. AJS327]